MSRSPSPNAFGALARGADVAPEWTATARNPRAREKSGTKSVWPRDTQKADRRLAAAKRALIERVFGARLRGDRFGQGRFVEFAAAPGNLRIFHRIRHAEILERRQKRAVDARPEVAFIDQVFLAKAKQVAAVAPIRGRRQTQQERGREMVDDPPVGCGRGVVEFVNNDVVESIGGEPLQMCGP